MAELHASVEEGDGDVRVALKGDLDVAAVFEFERAMAEAESRSPALVVLDLRELEFMDSMGLYHMIRASQHAEAAGRRLVIVRGPNPVHRLFELTSLQGRLEIVDDPTSI